MNHGRLGIHKKSQRRFAVNELTDGSLQQTHTPTSAEEVAEILREAVANRCSVSTSRDASADADARIDLQKMAAVVDYPARDMTVTVQAGMPVGELAEVLAGEKQQLPIDCPDSATTVGALVAGNIAGPRQFGYGTLRDYLIGVEAVDGQGRIFHAGGRVVKNVAGYDLCRLMVGSRGALGVLTQLTFKLKPIADKTEGIAFEFKNGESADNALEKLNTTQARPIVLDYSHDFKEPLFTLRVAVEGNKEACDWQLEQLRNDCEGGVEVPFSDVDRQSVEDYFRDPSNHWQRGALRIQTLPSKLIAIAQELASKSFVSRGHAGNSILYVRDQNQSGELRSICQGIIERHSGSVVDWDKDHPANNKTPLTNRLQTAFDSNSVFTRS